MTTDVSQMLPSPKKLAGQLPCRSEFFEVEGRPAFLFLPEKATTLSPMPWVWYAVTRDCSPADMHVWMFRQILQKGIAIAGVDVGESYGNPQGRAVFTALWKMLHTQRGMSDRPCLWATSRGGLMHYNWAVENSRRVACIVGIYPVCDLRSYPGLKKAAPTYGMTETELAACLAEHNPIERIKPLAEAGVPILHIHGKLDKVVPLERNSGELARRYRQLGGNMRVIVVPNKRHEMVPEFFQSQEFVDFLIEHALATGRRNVGATHRTKKGAENRRLASPPTHS